MIGVPFVMVGLLFEVIVGTRYLPIPLYTVEKPRAIASVSGGGEANFTQVHGLQLSRSGFEADILAASWLGIILYILLLVLLILVVTAYLVFHRNVTASEAIHRRFIRVESSEAKPLTIKYRYEGVGVILYRAYRWARLRLGCRSCSPRELALRLGSSDAGEFAKVYEETVYGRRPTSRTRAEQVAQRLVKLLSRG